MKTHLFALIILFSSSAFSQFTIHKDLKTSDWDIYPETNISYSNGKEDLKEILVLQSLLAENRVDEMFKMLGKFGYIPFPDIENTYWKNTNNPNYTENEMTPVIFIKNLGSTGVFYENYLKVWFNLIIKDNVSSQLSSTGIVPYKQAVRMQNLINIQLYPIGNQYKYLKSSWDGMGLPEDTTKEWVDRYTLKITSPKLTSIYKASNFSTLPIGMRQKEGFTTFLFNGPGKAYNTTMDIQVLTVYPNDKSKYWAPVINFASSVTDMFKTFKPESRQPFNIDFFMSLENFNDRIWYDN